MPDAAFTQAVYVSNGFIDIAQARINTSKLAHELIQILVGLFLFLILLLPIIPCPIHILDGLFEFAFNLDNRSILCWFSRVRHPSLFPIMLCAFIF